MLSKALRYAADVELIDRAPKVGLLKAERPEVAAWSLEEYARLVAAAQEMEPQWLAAACLAGEAGLRATAHRDHRNRGIVITENGAS